MAYLKLRFSTQHRCSSFLDNGARCERVNVTSPLGWTEGRRPDHVTVQPLGSVLVLTDFTGAVFNRAAVLAVKETAVFDKPYIKKSALIGTETFPKDSYEELKSFSRRDLRIFRSRDEALAWLVVDSG